jgi:hypothetical protein
MRIRIFLTLDPGSGINIPDPQHINWAREFLVGSRKSKNGPQNFFLEKLEVLYERLDA